MIGNHKVTKDGLIENIHEENYDVDKKNKCKLCSSNVIENEVHVGFLCPHYERIRNDITNKIASNTSVSQNSVNLSSMFRNLLEYKPIKKNINSWIKPDNDEYSVISNLFAYMILKIKRKRDTDILKLMKDKTVSKLPDTRNTTNTPQNETHRTQNNFEIPLRSIEENDTLDNHSRTHNTSSTNRNGTVPNTNDSTKIRYIRTETGITNPILRQFYLNLKKESRNFFTKEKNKDKRKDLSNKNSGKFTNNNLKSTNTKKETIIKRTKFNIELVNGSQKETSERKVNISPHNPKNNNATKNTSEKDTNTNKTAYPVLKRITKNTKERKNNNVNHARPISRSTAPKSLKAKIPYNPNKKKTCQ